MTRFLHEQALCQSALADCAAENGKRCSEPCGSCKASAKLNVEAYLTFLAEHGWKLAPRNATEDMVNAVLDSQPSVIGNFVEEWSTMHDAAPSPELENVG